MPGNGLPNPPENPRDLYIIAGLSLNQIAAQLKGFKGCSARQLARKCRDERWVLEREKHVSKVAAKTQEAAVTSEARLRARQLKNYEDAALIARGGLLRIGTRLHNEPDRVPSQHEAAAFSSLTRALDVAQRGERALVDPKDDRVSSILERAAELARDKIDDVVDWDVEEELQQALQPTAMIDLSFSGAAAKEEEAEVEKLVKLSDD